MGTIARCTRSTDHHVDIFCVKPRTLHPFGDLRHLKRFIENVNSYILCDTPISKVFHVSKLLLNLQWSISFTKDVDGP
jgi:hypothetical protein